MFVLFFQIIIIIIIIYYYNKILKTDNGSAQPPYTSPYTLHWRSKTQKSHIKESVQDVNRTYIRRSEDFLYTFNVLLVSRAFTQYYF